MTTVGHVIFGTGAVGLATYEALRRRGETVRLVNRSGHAPVPDDIEVLGGDARDPRFTSAAARGARVVYQTLNPPYTEWTAQFPALQAGVLAAAQAAGARLVSMENVYMYGRPAGHPLTEDRSYDAHTTKGQLRGRMARELLAAHQDGRVEVTIGRASDYFGPRGGAQSNLGDRVFTAALAGKTASVLGDLDQPHTYSYVPDIGEGLAVLGEHPDAAGQVWHLPNDPNTLTTRQLVDLVYRHAGRSRTKVRIDASPGAARRRTLQPDRAGAPRDGIPVRRTVHRGQQQDHRQARCPRHPGRPSPRRDPRDVLSSPHSEELHGRPHRPGHRWHRRHRQGDRAGAGRDGRTRRRHRARACSAHAAAREIRAAHGGQVETFVADLSSQAEVRRLAEEVQHSLRRIDVLINNVGGYWNTRRVTVDGLEHTFALNHLAPFLLTGLLLERLKQSGHARVVTVASHAHAQGRIDFDDLQGERSYSGARAYNESKLANVLFTYELARRLGTTGVTANALHPGVVSTAFGAEDPAAVQRWLVPILRPFMKSPAQGGATSIHLAAAPELQRVTGEYFAAPGPGSPRPAATTRPQRRGCGG